MNAGDYSGGFGIAFLASLMHRQVFLDRSPGANYRLSDIGTHETASFVCIFICSGNGTIGGH
jgi:hypothetical protein